MSLPSSEGSPFSLPAFTVVFPLFCKQAAFLGYQIAVVLLRILKISRQLSLGYTAVGYQIAVVLLKILKISRQLSLGYQIVVVLLRILKISRQLSI